MEVTQLGFAFFKNNFFFKIAEESVQQLTSAGILFWMIDNEIGLKYKFTSKKEPTKLTIENLNFGFVIWIGFCGISVIAFVCEILYRKLRHKIKNFQHIWSRIQAIKSSIIKNLKEIKKQHKKQVKVFKPSKVKKITYLSSKPLLPKVK